jgi:hypothetical protein
MRGLLASLLLAAILPTLLIVQAVSAAGLSNRSLRLDDIRAASTTDYTLTFTVDSASTLGSLKIMVCNNSPIDTDPCDLPSSLDFTNATLASQTGLTDFSLFVAATNQLVLSRTPTVIAAPMTISLVFHNVVNPSPPGSYYMRLSTYASNNATGPETNFGGLAFGITNNLQISSYVPPYLIFCAGVTIPAFDCASASGDYVNFGGLNSSRSDQAASQLMVATNAGNGYVIQVYGTTMTSGNNVIPAITNGAGSQPGTSQFGLNLRANTSPAIGADPTGPGSGQPTANYNNPNHFQFVSSDTIVNSITADNFRKYTVSYLLNASPSQPGGVYVSTLTYVCAGSF